MGNNSHKPAIRFQGFTDAWEQRKLGAAVNSIDTGKSKFDKEGSSGNYAILGSTSVIGYDTEYDYEGDFILTARVGANAGSLYRHTGKVKISDNTVFIQASENIEFLYHLLTQFNIKKLSFGTGQPLVKTSELKNLELMMPTDTKEQIKIGDCFKALDNLITLHQRKYEKLLTVKKSILEKMFPRDGSNNPEIRFIGFTDPWEQRKLGDIADTKTGPFGTQLSAKEYTASGIPVINVKNIGTGCIQENDLDYVSESTAKRLSDHIIQENDIVFGRKGAIGRHAIIGKTQNNWVQGSDCIRVRFKPGIVASYVNAQLQTANVIDHLYMNAYGSTMLTLTTDMINSIPLLMPEEAEQSEIAHVFSDIDNLITLYHLKLEKLKNIKQSLLQNMFV